MSASVTTEPATEPAKKSGKKATQADDALAPHNSNLNLFQRIHAIMGDVRRLQKDKAVGSGSYAYKAVSEEKVVTEIRTAMLRHGVVMFPIEQHHHLVDHLRPGRDGTSTVVSMSTVDVRYKLANVDNMEEFEIIASSGTGVDPQDKGVGKAMTYSFKYALLRTFMIPTGADPDDVHNEDLAAQQAQRAAQGKQLAGAGAQVSGGPAASTTAGESGEPVRYTTPMQVEEIKRLVDHPLISKEIKTKTLTSLPSLSEAQGERVIAKLNKTINDGNA